MKKTSPAIVAIAFAIELGMPLRGLAQTPTNSSSATAAEIQSLKQELNALRAAYEERLQAMEKRLQAAEAAANAAPPASAPPPVSAPPPPQVAAAGGGNAFNPAMSLILSGTYAHTSQDPAGYRLAGFQLPADAEVGPGPRGFSLAESELGLAANIDPWFRGSAAIAFDAENEVSVEEAYIQTTSLNNGLSIRGGRFFSGVGYLNAQHAHVWDFVDAPLAYQALLGTQYGDDGVQVSWLAPTDQFIQLGVEAGRGRSFPGSNLDRNAAGMTAFTAHTGGDIGISSSWRAGISLLRAKAEDQQLGMLDADANAISNAFTGNTQVWVADAVWKWAPNGNGVRTNFKLQGEYLRSRRSGALTYDLDGASLADAYRATQSGWYVQGVYQFRRYWRVGARTEHLNIGNTDFGANSDLFGFETDAPRKHSVMIDFSPSEFSRIRLQLARDYSSGTSADNQAYLQYQMSLGAHGAHTY